MTYSIVDSPTNGNVVLNGKIATYTPTTDYIGTDSFTFKVNNGEFDSALGSVLLTIDPVVVP